MPPDRALIEETKSWLRKARRYLEAATFELPRR